MEQSLLASAILNINPDLNPESLSQGLKRFQSKPYKAKSPLLRFGETSDTLFFVESSVTRCYYLNSDDEEQTLWMKPEQQFITEYKSFVNQNPSTFSLQLYEDSIVHSISRSELEGLYKEHTDWAIWGVRLLESLHVTLIDVFVNLLANDATRNYQYIEYMFPKFIQVAPLKDIASMLQVTPVTLSRIRAGNQTKH